MHYTVEQREVFPKADDGDDRQNTLEVGDDEFVLEAEFRNANRLVVAVAVPQTTPDRCQHVKENGAEQCSRDAEDGSEYCWQHEQ